MLPLSHVITFGAAVGLAPEWFLAWAVLNLITWTLHFQTCWEYFYSDPVPATIAMRLFVALGALAGSILQDMNVRRAFVLQMRLESEKNRRIEQCAGPGLNRSEACAPA